MLIFEDATITIVVADGDGQPEQQEHPGKVAVGTGLGYWIERTEMGNPFYTPTHIESGRSLCSHFILRESLTQEIIERVVATGFNWDRSHEELLADPGMHMAVARGRRIIDALLQAHPEHWIRVSDDFDGLLSGQKAAKKEEEYMEKQALTNAYIDRTDETACAHIQALHRLMSTFDYTDDVDVDHAKDLLILYQQIQRVQKDVRDRFAQPRKDQHHDQ